MNGQGVAAQEGEGMLSRESAEAFAREWVEAWNSHEIERIMSHYSDDVVLVSPVAAGLLGHAQVTGKDAVRHYFEKGLAAYPDLRFVLDRVLLGQDSVVLLYTRQDGIQAAEFMVLDAQGKVARMHAHYEGR